MVEPKAKNKYKTKKKNEKNVIMEKLVIITQTMAGGKHHDEKAWSLKDLVEEVAYLAPKKSKKTRWDETNPNKAKAHERTPSLIKQRKGVDKVSVGSSVKIPTTPQKHKRKEKALRPIVKSDEYLNFHSSESSGDMNSLIAPLDASRREKRGKQALEHLVMDESFERQEKEAPWVEKSSKTFLAFMDIFCVFVV